MHELTSWVSRFLLIGLSIWVTKQKQKKIIIIIIIIIIKDFGLMMHACVDSLCFNVAFIIKAGWLVVGLLLLQG